MQRVSDGAGRVLTAWWVEHYGDAFLVRGGGAASHSAIEVKAANFQNRTLWIGDHQLA